MLVIKATTFSIFIALILDIITIPIIGIIAKADNNM